MQKQPPRKRRLRLLPMLLLACAAAATHPASPQGRPAAKRDLKVIRLAGSACERGLQHGTRLRSEIATLITLWKDDLRKATGANPDASIVYHTNRPVAVARTRPVAAMPPARGRFG
jgi:hypothetical protein